jgi:hypothetical protein
LSNDRKSFELALKRFLHVNSFCWASILIINVDYVWCDYNVCFRCLIKLLLYVDKCLLADCYVF